MRLFENRTPLQKGWFYRQGTKKGIAPIILKLWSMPVVEEGLN
jgi:hypothetical protein